MVYKNNINHTYRLVDKAFKEYGVLLSKAQKDEIIQTKDCVISSKIAVFVDDSSIHIAPYVNIVIPKKIKEQYRISKIPPKMRGYLYYLRKNK
ncbi:tRNA(Ile)-lysidine synthetase [hydrothermal vent metagenome]|uniref:tRNA(Ile)-lysidine synthetase n=1 Tax=hydrothermal vent metagenome TaxID=652676 RepID=A0A3B1EAD3_9ZZZZ